MPKHWKPAGSESVRKEVAPTIPDGDIAASICTLWCFDNSLDGEACKHVCLDLKENNHGLYHRALLRAERDGLKEPHQHIFAAGAVWAWLSMTGLQKPQEKKT